MFSIVCFKFLVTDVLNCLSYRKSDLFSSINHNCHLFGHSDKQLYRKVVKTGCIKWWLDALTKVFFIKKN